MTWAEYFDAYPFTLFIFGWASGAIFVVLCDMFFRLIYGRSI